MSAKTTSHRFAECQMRLCDNLFGPPIAKTLYMANSRSSGDWQFKQPVAMVWPGIVVQACKLRYLTAFDFFARFIAVESRWS
jgi:hypothetical protein